MNIMNKLTRKHMISNKKRTLVTICGVIIAAAMMIAVSAGIATFREFLAQIEMQDSGKWHVMYHDVAKEDTTAIAEKASDDVIFYKKELGHAFLDGLTNEDKPYIYGEAYDETAFSMMGIQLLEGRLPESSKEILVSKYMLEDGNETFHIGDTITVQFGTRMIRKEDGTECELTNGWAYYGSRYEEDRQEWLVKDGQEMTFTIVGIMEKPTFETTFGAGYTAITYLDEALYDKMGTADAYIFSNHLSMNTIDELVDFAGKLSHSNASPETNEGPLRYYGYSMDPSFNDMVSFLELFLMILIMVGSVALIYNSFAISISERSKQFGMLSSVGATKRQKRNAVFYEAFLIGSISIPIGLLCGIAGVGITFSILKPYFGGFTDSGQEVPLRLVVSAQSVVTAVLFAIVTIFIAAYIPARKASRVSPMEAIRQTKDIKISGNAVKTGRLVHKLFGFEGELALKNLKRNKKRYRALVFSLFISLVLFISVGTFVSYLSQAFKMTYAENNFDIMIRNLDQEKQPGIREAINRLPDVKETEVITYVPMDYTMGEALKQYETADYRQKLRERYERMGYEGEELEERISENLFFFYIRALDEESLNRYAKKWGISISTDSNDMQAILVNKQKDQSGYGMIECVPTSLASGMTISLNHDIYDGQSSETDVIDTEQVQLTIAGVTEELVMGMSYPNIGDGVLLYVSQSVYEKIMSETKESGMKFVSGIYMTANHAENLNDEIETILKENGQRNASLLNIADEMKQTNQLIVIFSVFCYGFIVLISMICIANLCNTISTSMDLRRKEFAMIKSVGMTPAAFRKMIRFESMFYGMKALLYGIPLSLLLGAWIEKRLSNMYDTTYSFPFHIYLIGILAVFVIVLTTMTYAGAKIRRENIVDGLRADVA